MAIATRTNTTLAATITQTNLVAAIKTAMANAGFTTLYDEFTNANSSRILIYEVISDSSKTYGKIYYSIAINTSLLVASELYTSWNTSTKTGANTDTSATFTTFVTGSSISFAAFNGGDECKLVVAVQGTNVVTLGILAPASRPSWWDLNLWSWGFFPSVNTFVSWRGTGMNPYSNSGYQFISMTNVSLATANPQTNKRDVITGLILSTASNAGVSGKTSDDLAIVCASGSSRYDTIQPQGTTQVFTILHNAAGGMAIRTA